MIQEAVGKRGKHANCVWSELSSCVRIQSFLQRQPQFGTDYKWDTSDKIMDFILLGASCSIMPPTHAAPSEQKWVELD